MRNRIQPVEVHHGVDFIFAVHEFIVLEFLSVITVVAAVLHRKKPIDCDIGILRYEVEGIYRVESTAAGRTTKDYK